MKTEKAHCAHCGHTVRLTLTEAHRDGPANLPDGGAEVCLDFQEGCVGGTCPLTGRAGIVMGVRLARTDLRDATEWERVHARCEGCDAIREMEVLDEGWAFCPVCKTTNRLQTLQLSDGAGLLVVTELREAGPEGGTPHGQ